MGKAGCYFPAGFMVRLLGKIALQVLLFPFKLPLALAFRWCWRPSWKIDVKMFDDRARDFSLDDLRASVDREAYANSGDGAKAIGLLYAATLDNESWEWVKLFWRGAEGTFARYPSSLRDAGAKNFSGDMLAGMLYAIVQRMWSCGLTDDECHVLRGIWRRTVFNAPVLEFKHPVKTGPQDRGKLLGWMSFGPDLLTTLVFLGVGALLERDWENRGLDWEQEDAADNGRDIWSYRFISRVLRLCLWPMLVCVDTAFALGRWYAAAWYDEHSQALLYSVGAMFSRSFDRPLRRLAERYPHNPDIQALYWRHGGSPRLRGVCWGRAWNFLRDYHPDRVGTQTPPEWWMDTFYSIRNIFEGKAPGKRLSRFVLPSRFRSGNYLWECNDVQPATGNKAGLYVDYLFLRALMTGGRQEWARRTWNLWPPP